MYSRIVVGYDGREHGAGRSKLENALAAMTT